MFDAQHIGILEDESNACDWDNPAEVNADPSGYKIWEGLDKLTFTRSHYGRDEIDPAEETVERDKNVEFDMEM